MVCIGLRVCWKQWEINYHLGRLSWLNGESLKVIDGGYAIDDTHENAAPHRDRLTALGVFFCKNYELDSRFGSSELRRRLVVCLEKRFPQNSYWELSENNNLRVWDFANREGEWDLFIESELPVESEEVSVPAEEQPPRTF